MPCELKHVGSSWGGGELKIRSTCCWHSEVAAYQMDSGVDFRGGGVVGGSSAWLELKTPPTVEPDPVISLGSDGKLSSVTTRPWLPHPTWNWADEAGEQRRDRRWVCLTEVVFTQMCWIFVFFRIRIGYQGTKGWLHVCDSYCLFVVNLVSRFTIHCCYLVLSVKVYKRVM